MECSNAEEISEDCYVHLGGGMQGRKRKAIVTPNKLQVTGIEIQNKKGQAQYLHVVKDAQRVSEENRKLRLQLALKTKELEREQNRRLKLELALKTKEIESLRKQNKELRAENEHYKKTAKPPRVPRLCRSCNKCVLYDYRNCPMRQCSGSDEEQEGDDSN